MKCVIPTTQQPISAAKSTSAWSPRRTSLVLFMSPLTALTIRSIIDDEKAPGPILGSERRYVLEIKEAVPHPFEYLDAISVGSHSLKSRFDGMSHAVFTRPDCDVAYLSLGAIRPLPSSC